MWSEFYQPHSMCACSNQLRSTGLLNLPTGKLLPFVQHLSTTPDVASDEFLQQLLPADGLLSATCVLPDGLSAGYLMPSGNAGSFACSGSCQPATCDNSASCLSRSLPAGQLLPTVLPDRSSGLWLQQRLRKWL
ncbi:MAG: hypothetical protein AAF456_06945 [Planctomycetota bacterium]